MMAPMILPRRAIGSARCAWMHVADTRLQAEQGD